MLIREPVIKKASKRAGGLKLPEPKSSRLVRVRPQEKFLIPVDRLDWIQPSQRVAIFGIESQTRFRLTARTHDGHIVWRGWFDDRDDFDAVLLAISAERRKCSPRAG